MKPNLSTAARPAAPQNWALTPSPGLQLDRHHMIPYSLLKDVWNVLLDRFYASQSADVARAVRRYISLMDPAMKDIDANLASIRRDKLTDADCIALRTSLSWPAWNIVEGPKNRSDDIDKVALDLFTKGITPLELKRMNAVRRMYFALKQFERMEGTEAEILSFLEFLQRQSQGVFAVDGMIRFRAEMWEQDKASGRWHKRL